MINSCKIVLVVEFILLFVTLPLIFVFNLLPSLAMMPMLFGAFLYTLYILKKNSIKVFQWDMAKNMLPFLLLRVVVISVILYMYTLLYKPQNLFYFVKTTPLIWLMVIIFYPFFSAFTQEVIFRKFFFFRYPGLWKNNQIITIFLSAFLFSYMHIVFDNFIALSFTFVGGLIFATIYTKTKSLMLVSLEHGIYGDILFTLGLGYYFYHGSIG